MKKWTTTEIQRKFKFCIELSSNDWEQRKLGDLVASKDVSGYYLIENGEFAYNKSTSTDAPWGAIKRLDRYENGVLSTLYIVFGMGYGCIRGFIKGVKRLRRCHTPNGGIDYP